MRNGKRATNSHPTEAFILRNVQSRRSSLMGRSPKSPNSNSNNGQKNGNGPPTVTASDQVIDSSPGRGPPPGKGPPSSVPPSAPSIAPTTSPASAPPPPPPVTSTLASTPASTVAALSVSEPSILSRTIIPNSAPISAAPTTSAGLLTRPYSESSEYSLSQDDDIRSSVTTPSTLSLLTSSSMLIPHSTGLASSTYVSNSAPQTGMMQMPSSTAVADSEHSPPTPKAKIVGGTLGEREHMHDIHHS